MNSLAEYIKEKRALRGYSMRKLAEEANISHTEVKRIEDGVRKQPSPQVLRSLSNALHISYEETMAAAGYIDDPDDEQPIAAAGIQDTSDLSAEEVAKVNKYIAFIKSQRKD
jgi:transcriptional regulator with XRE-family HTH domain